MAVGTPVSLGVDGAGRTSTGVNATGPFSVSMSRAATTGTVLLLHVDIDRQGATPPTPPSVSGGGVTWTLYPPGTGYEWDSTADGTNAISKFVFVAVAASPSGTSITVTPGEAYRNAIANVIELPGVATTNGGFDAFVQRVTSPAFTGSTQTVVMEQLADTTNNGFLALGAHYRGAASSGRTFTPSGGFSGITDSSRANVDNHVLATYAAYQIGNASEDPSVGYTLSGGVDYSGLLVLELTEGSSGTEYEDELEEAAEAGESVSAQLNAVGAVTEAAEAGESVSGRLDMHASIEAGAESGMSFDTDLSFDTEDEGAESGATFGATVTIPLSFTAGAVAGDEFEGTGDENKSIEDGAASGDTFGALMAALGSTTDGAESGDDYASILAGSGGWDAGAESGDGWEAHLTSYADWSAGASAGMALSTVAPPVETPLIVITRALRFTRFILRILRF